MFNCFKTDIEILEDYDWFLTQINPVPTAWIAQILGRSREYYWQMLDRQIRVPFPPLALLVEFACVFFFLCTMDVHHKFDKHLLFPIVWSRFRITTIGCDFVFAKIWQTYLTMGIMIICTVHILYMFIFKKWYCSCTSYSYSSWAIASTWLDTYSMVAGLQFW